MRIAYLAHNLDDPAVARRVRMFRLGGADVDLAGFRRATDDAVPIEGKLPLALGRTEDGKFLRRIASVATARLPESFLADIDIIVARNLEMLAIAMRHRRVRGRIIPVVYECLDIHKLLTGGGVASRLLRALEGRLSKGASLLITSSPAFIREYFTQKSSVSLPTLLVQNKVLDTGENSRGISARPPRPAPPWRIGWFGAIRCKRSLAILGALSQAMDGRVEIVIRGRPAYSEFDDFHAKVARYRHVSFLGPYDNATDLPAIYGDVHFAWAIDLFEKGLNSTWLLPNRVYESSRYGAVPIAQAGVETGRFLSDAEIGVLLGDDIEGDLRSYLERLSPADYDAEKAKVAAVPASRWIYDAADCRRLVETLNSVARGNPVQEAVL